MLFVEYVIGVLVVMYSIYLLIAVRGVRICESWFGKILNY